eukprot:ctg_1404.g427
MLPPGAPSIPITPCRRGDAEVTDGRVEPHIEHLVGETVQRHRNAPLQIAGDAARFQAVAQPAAGHGQRVVAPAAALGCRVDPSLQRIGQARQLQEEVARGTHLGHTAGQRRSRSHQLGRVQQVAALVALIALGVLVAATRTGAVHVAVGQKLARLHIIQLRHGLLRAVPIVVYLPEDLLTYLGLARRRGAPKMVETQVEPAINVPVQPVVLVAQLSWCDALLGRLGLGGRAVLIRAADEQHVHPGLSQVAGVHVRRQHRPDQIAQVRHVIHVGEGRSHQHVPLTGYRCRQRCVYRHLLQRRRQLVISRVHEGAVVSCGVSAAADGNNARPRAGQNRCRWRTRRVAAGGAEGRDGLERGESMGEWVTRGMKGCCSCV